MKDKYFLKSISAVFIVSFLLPSCYHTKEISYFQDFDKYQQGLATVNTQDNYQIKIRSDDELRIIVSAAINPEAATPFNLSPVISQSPSSSNVTNNATYQSYLVDETGFVTIPSLGKVKVGGLTVEQAKAEVESRLKEYIKDPIVTLRLLSFRVTVLGEVNSPGTQYYDRQRVSIIDAISQARDLSIFAQRNNIRLIRDDGGKKEYYVYDLTKNDFMSSSYFYLKPNDLIYVVPNKERQGDAVMGQEKQYRTSLTMSIVSLTMGVVSTMATIFAITK
ncbi:MAG: sugar transporter [Bacteroidetes bacterium]|nr:sugar transporter [Bacteroidota bacterium]